MQPKDTAAEEDALTGYEKILTSLSKLKINKVAAFQSATCWRFHPRARPILAGYILTSMPLSMGRTRERTVLKSNLTFDFEREKF